MGGLWDAAAGSVQVHVGAGWAEPQVRGRLPAPAAVWVAADLAMWRRPWGSGFGLLVGVEITAEPRMPECLHLQLLPSGWP